jgi:outer membrane receptor protein involved in Fe transport
MSRPVGPRHGLVFFFCILTALASLSLSVPSRAQASTLGIETVTVTAERRQLLGTAETSSQGVVVNDELALTPAYRAGQMLETVPGLVVTSHSGEGKANEYLLRGFSLDHGTDLAVSVDGMPINERTHAHGQGYTDLNFMIPELATDIQYTKGPYFAAKGDFASVGTVDIGYLNRIDNQVNVTMGTMGFERLFTAGSRDMGAGTLLGALELQHYDGPWDSPDNQRKMNAVMRYSSGDPDDGYSLTAMYYGGLWNATTDQPVRAITQGLIGRFGSLDPTDGGQAQRYSLSGQYHSALGPGALEAHAYAIGNRLTLWNDFTHFLTDPVHGDQEAQTENRVTLGGGASYLLSDAVWGIPNDFLAGFDTRYDGNHVFRNFTRARRFLGVAENDRVNEGSFGAYLQATTHWTSWLRSVVGIREDYFGANDNGTNQGRASQDLFQPKGSLIFTLSPQTEFYISGGRGFHSDDVRGVTQAAAQGLRGAPLLARSTGDEIGVREQLLPNLSATLTLFQISFQSELTYDPDAGQTSAGPPSRRSGVELNTTWQALDWLEFYGSFASSHARYSEESDDGTGHIGRYIPEAPTAIGNLAIYVKHLDGHWGGGLEYRYLGSYPLTPDNAVRASGYGEWNGEVGYTFDSGWRLQAGLYNILNTRANAAEFWYVDRLPGEPAGGVPDRHIHPLEPISLRLTLGKSF